MKNSLTLLSKAFWILTLLFACNTSNNLGCGNDNDCKGERICVNRQCVDPASQVKSPNEPKIQATPPSVNSQENSNQPAAIKVLPAPALGARVPLVVVTEMGDFQCQLCAGARKIIHDLLKSFTKDNNNTDLRVEWRHNPLEKHKNAILLAQAAIAAHLQGRFWQFHDRLFNQQETLRAAPEQVGETLSGHAKVLKLDLKQWNSERRNVRLKNAVQLARKRAIVLGAKGTPAFFVNGRLIGGLQSVQRIRGVIEEELTKARKLLAQGTARGQIVSQLTRANNPLFGKLFYDGATPKPAAPAKATVSKTVWKVPIRAHNPQQGPANALVTLVEFADFECPFCAKQHTVLNELLKQYPKTLRVVFKNSPQAFHKNAVASAHAGAFAHDQGRFWAFAKRAFARQTDLNEKSLVQHAVGLGLNAREATSAITRKRFFKQIAADQSDAAAVSAVGTPYIFLNGRKIVGFRNARDLSVLIEEEIAKARALVAQGTPAAKVYERIIATGKQNQALSHGRQTLTVVGRPTKGPENAPIQLTIFADFQCPFSRNLVPILQRVGQAFRGKVHTVFKHMPQDFHKDARSAAMIAVCAHQQNRFWDFHKTLFTPQKQQLMNVDTLKKYAKESGLETQKLDACLKSGHPGKIIDQDLSEAKTAGAKGTPTVFINGRLFNSPTGYNDRSFTRVFTQVLGALGK
ncbi:MAG TPA: hypothetical protein EYN06_01840 [Myxococcales bacterium]|nr:hypothetical protein [Myxococcales bacterium]